MLTFFRKTFISLVIAAFVLPVIVFAQAGGGSPDIVWDDQIVVEETGGQFLTTGSVGVSNLVNPGSLSVLILIDTDSEFDLPVQIINLGIPPANGVMDFNVTSYQPGTFFLAVIVNTSSYTGSLFNPYSTNQFQTLIIGQVAVNNLEVIGEDDGGGELGDNDDDGGGPLGDGPGDGGGPLGDPGLGNYTFTSTINNPLGEDFDILEFLQKLFGNLVKIAIPILVIFMIYSGFLFVEARGDTEKLSKARNNFKYVIIGGLLIFGAWTIAMALKGTVDQLEAPISLITNFINLV